MTRLIILFLFAATLAKAQPVSEQQKKGTVTRYYPGTKQIHYSGTVNKHLREATWVFYSMAGERIKTEEYRAGLLHGKTEVYFRDIKIVSEQYADNLLHGPQQYWYKNGDPMLTEYYTAGTIDSVFSYNPGDKSVREKVTMRNGKYSRYVGYHYDGSVAETGSYDTAGLKTGTWRTYHRPKNEADTMPDLVIQFAGGKRNGTCVKREYLRQTTSNYVNDTLHGPLLHLGKFGLRYTVNYTMGKMDGLEQTFRNDRLEQEATWRDGHKTGVEKTYHENGNILTWSFFGPNYELFGARDSSCTYNALGKITYQEVNQVKNGIKIYKCSWWHDNGKPSRFELYHDQKPIGEFKCWNEQGRLVRLERFEGSKRHGLQQAWYDNGRKKIEVTFRNGQQQEPVKAWNADGTVADIRSAKVADWNEWIELHVTLPPLREEMSDDSELNAGWRDTDGEGLAEQPTPESVVSPIKEAPVTPEDIRITWQESNPKPEFPGGEQALQQFIRDNLHYPAIEKARGTSCTVQLTFIVNKEGVLENIYAFRKPANAPAFGVEAERLASTMPRWKPGMKNGKVCSVAMTLDISFTLPAK